MIFIKCNDVANIPIPDIILLFKLQINFVGFRIRELVTIKILWKRVRGKPDSFITTSVNISSPTTIQLNFTQKTSKSSFIVRKKLTPTTKKVAKSYKRSIILTVNHSNQLYVFVAKIIKRRSKFHSSIPKIVNVMQNLLTNYTNI